MCMKLDPKINSLELVSQRHKISEYEAKIGESNVLLDTQQ